MQGCLDIFGRLLAECGYPNVPHLPSVFTPVRSLPSQRHALAELGADWIEGELLPRKRQFLGVASTVGANGERDLAE